MRQQRIVNLSDLLFCLAPEWEAANLKKVDKSLRDSQYGNNVRGDNKEAFLFLAKSSFGLCVVADCFSHCDGVEGRVAWYITAP